MSPSRFLEENNPVSFDYGHLTTVPDDSFFDSTPLSWGTPSSHDLTNFKIQLVHFVLGCTALVPSTLLATVIPFFRSRVVGSPFAGAFSSYLYIAHNSSAFIFLAHATAVSKSSLPTRQTRLTICALFLLIFLTTLTTLVRTTPTCVSYFQSSVFVVASIFGPRAIQAVMAGQAAIGVVVNLVQLVSVAMSLRTRSVQSERTPEELSAFACFAFATCLLGVSLVAHDWLVRSPAYKILIVPIEWRITTGTLQERQTLRASSDVACIINPGKETPRERMVRVARANMIYELAVAYVFIVTLSVFPPITTFIMPVNRWFHPLFFNAIHILLFCLGDLLGRHLCTFPSLLIWSPYRLLGLSLAHTLFVPLFIACNIQLPSSTRPGSSPFIDSDFLFFLILFTFGTSNGYVSTLCLVAAPSLEHNKKLKDQEDVNMAMTIGLFLYGRRVDGGELYELCNKDDGVSV